MTQDKDGKVLRIIVYVVLVASAAAAVLFGDRLWTASRVGYLPIWAPLLAPGAFTLFVIVYAADRLHLVRKRNYPLSRALFQGAFALVFLMLLADQQASEFRLAKLEDDTLKAPALLLLQNGDDAVRHAACDILIGRLPLEVVERVANLAHNDPALPVRMACNQALQRISSVTGAPEHS